MNARLLVVTFAIPLLLGGGKEPALKLFTSIEGAFTVLLPATPQKQEVPLKDPKGGPPQYQYAVDRGQGAYLVSYQDNPALKDATDEALYRSLTRARNGVQATFKGKLLDEKRIKLGGKYPGLAFEVEVPAGLGLYRSRMYLVRRRLYQVSVVGVKEFARSEEADKVLGSFKLTEFPPPRQ